MINTRQEPFALSKVNYYTRPTWKDLRDLLQIQKGHPLWPDITFATDMMG